MQSLEKCGLIQMCLWKGVFGTDTAHRREPCADEGRGAGKMFLWAQECQRCPRSAELKGRGRASLGKNQPWEQDWSVGPCARPCTATAMCWAAHTACILSHSPRMPGSRCYHWFAGGGRWPHHPASPASSHSPAQMTGSQGICIKRVGS